ncbi:rhodanese-like domain-containing protein [candidate division KSB1 bacterium]|nr:rhodanese-like domain-containing protein [candidate division KSB1 bacterium]
MKFLPNKTLTEAFFIIILALIIGFSSNLFHPNKVNISFSHPPIEFVEDNIPAQTLPEIEVNSTDPIQEPYLLKTQEIVKLLKKDQALLLDARSKKEYQKEHIPGARHLSNNDLLKNKNITETLPQDKWLICYCEGPGCDQAEILAYELIFSGYQRIAVYPGGLKGWKNWSNSQIETRDQPDEK